MKTFILLLSLTFSLYSNAYDPESNFGDVLVGPSGVQLDSFEYNRGDSFDPTFESLTREQSLGVILDRMAKFDSIKALDWKLRIEKLWNSRIELPNVKMSSKRATYVKDHAYECTYRFRGNRFLVAADTFYRLPGFQQAFLILQAFQLQDHFTNGKNRLFEVEFNMKTTVAPYFSVHNGHGRYLDFIKFYQQLNYPHYGPLWNTEFQIGTTYVGLSISHEFLNADLVDEDTNTLYRFNPTRPMSFRILEDQVVNVVRSSPTITLNQDGSLSHLESGDTTYLIKNLNFSERLVLGFKLSDDGKAVDWIQVPSEGNQIFRTVRNEPFEIEDYSLPYLYLKNNLVYKICNFKKSECRVF